MTQSHVSRRDRYARHRDENCAIMRRYYAAHRDECGLTIRKRSEYIRRKVREIELNDDPESLLYTGNFVEYSRSYKKKGA